MNGDKPVEKYSQRYWELLKNLADCLRKHGQNVYLIHPLEHIAVRFDGKKYSFDFSPFDNVVEFFIKEGNLKRIEGGPLASPRNSVLNIPILKDGDKENPTGETIIQAMPLSDERAKNYLSQFIPSFYKHLRKKGWDKIYLQHICDEPNNADNSYNALADYLRMLEPSIKFIDASGLGEKAGKCLDVHIPIIWHYPPNEKFYRHHQESGGEVWLYISCETRKGYPNRFYDRPLLENRLLHWFNFRSGTTGYLHWGLNYWQKESAILTTPQSLKIYNDKHKNLLPGDRFIVYPDFGRVHSSLRFETMRDAVADYELLKMLSQTQPEKAKKIAEAMIPQPNQMETDISVFRTKRHELLTLLNRLEPFGR
ncbi:MAG: DUF4091 domain-containing protein [Planctomycetaceae bacterium]|jgi:hypothetical protein|nr:DUF4091 domain-containing protein [Planctomycetaceae bacterium]